MILNMQFHFHVWTLRPHSTGPRIGLSVKLTLLYPTRMPRREVKRFCCRCFVFKLSSVFLTENISSVTQSRRKILLAFLKGKLSLKIYTPYLIFDLGVSIVLKRHCCAKTLVQQGCKQLRNKRRFPPSLDPAEEHAKGKYTAIHSHVYKHLY